MKLSGRNIRRIYSSENLAFDADIEISNLTGEAYFGVSGIVAEGDPGGGNPKSTLFNFKSGRVFDPNGNNVFSYQRNTPINLKGTFSSTAYDYFIDDNLISSVGTKDNYLIDKIFLETENCELEVNDLNFYGPTGTLDLNTPLVFGVNIMGSIGTAGSVGHGSVGDGSNVYETTSRAGDYMTFKNAIVFNKDEDGRDDGAIKGDVISGEVTLGSEFFEFDNRESYLKTLSGVVGRVEDGSNIKDLKLRANTNLTEGAYPVEINFYTTFGNITRNTTILGGSLDNPSGVKINILGDGYPLQSGQNSTHALASQNGEPVSGEFSINYSVDIPEGIDASDGIPYKVYLEHVEGDHSKHYSFITGVELSGSGKGYAVDSQGLFLGGDMTREVTFRIGDIGDSNPENINGATFGSQLEEKATGLISDSNQYQGMLTEANIDSIRTNLHKDIDISSITESVQEGSGTATATSSTPHNLSDGDSVTISGATPAAYNNTFVVTVATATTFTFSIASGTGNASGTIKAEVLGAYESNIQKMNDGVLMTQHTHVEDIVTVFSTSLVDNVSEKPSGIAKVYSYQKPVTDWKMFTGTYGRDTSSYIEHTQTGISDTPLRRHKGDGGTFLGVVLRAKNYLDTDPMVYNLVFSGGDGYGEKKSITGTVMETGYNPPLIPII